MTGRGVEADQPDFAPLHFSSSMPNGGSLVIYCLQPMSRRYPVLIASTTRDFHGDHLTENLQSDRRGHRCTQ